MGDFKGSQDEKERHHLESTALPPIFTCCSVRIRRGQRSEEAPHVYGWLDLGQRVFGRPRVVKKCVAHYLIESRSTIFFRERNVCEAKDSDVSPGILVLRRNGRAGRMQFASFWLTFQRGLHPQAQESALACEERDTVACEEGTPKGFQCRMPFGDEVTRIDHLGRIIDSAKVLPTATKLHLGPPWLIKTKPK